MSVDVTYRVRVNWSGKALSFGGTYADVTDDVLNFQTKIGRDKMQNKFNAGQVDIQFKDTGKYNPYNSSSPIYGSVLPMRAVMIDFSTDGGSTYPYVGFIGWSRTGDSNPDFGVQRAGMHCEDVFLRLARSKPVITEMGQVLSGDAIDAILDASVSDLTTRSLDAGHTLAHFSADGSTDALSLISNIMDIEQGIFFQAPDGTLTFYDSGHWGQLSSLGTISLAQANLPGYDLDSVINSARITADGGTEQVNQDSTSISDYGESAFGGVGDTSLLTGDQAADDLGAYIVGEYKDPSDRIWGVKVSEGPSGYLPIMLGASIWDTVTLDTAVASDDFIVENIQHRGEGGALHLTEWGMRVRPSGAALPFRLDDSSRGLDSGHGMRY